MSRNNNINMRKFALPSGLLLFRLNKNDFVNRENTYGELDALLFFFSEKILDIRFKQIDENEHRRFVKCTL